MNRVFLFFKKSVQLLADIIYTQHLLNRKYKHRIAALIGLNKKTPDNFLRWNEYQSHIQLKEKWDFIRSVPNEQVRYAR